MNSSDPTFPTRRAARAEAERRATAAIPIAEADSGPRRSTFEEHVPSDQPLTRRARREEESPRTALGALLLRRRLAVAAAGIVVVAACAVAIGAAATGGRQDAAGPANAAGADAVAVVQGPPAVPAEGLPVPTLAAAPRGRDALRQPRIHRRSRREGRRSGDRRGRWGSEVP
ncbi:hypothetical protein QE406_000811 [Microbacterium testaceum]|uniref:hypothetical protein n=1 Tax=Microbacterium testaceum TaxID=2033 RepID=UPI00277EBCAF|nr:hypothetical protein [Microbacterium testaceum]MDQ1114802.1 hypothetical protein [Microbacterium testaceum]